MIPSCSKITPSKENNERDMKYCNRILLLSLVFLLAIALVFISACADFCQIRIQNHTDQELTLLLGAGSDSRSKTRELHYRVEPGSEVTERVLLMKEYTIIAKNSEGVVVFDKTFTPGKLDDIDWTVVITDNNTPLKNW